MRTNIILSAFLISFFIGCGGGSGGDSKQEKSSSISEKYTSPTDMYFNEQWYLAKNEIFYKIRNINDDAHVHGGKYFNIYRGRGVKVAIIDDGFNINHIGFKDAIITKYYSRDDSTNVQNDKNESHGTEVAGFVGARANDDYVFGTASQSELILMKYDENTMQTDADTIKLLTKAKELGADIINCSWGTENVSPSVKSVIQDLATTGRDGKGILLVFASGNDGKNLDMLNDESAIPEVIAVGASNMANKRASYSNFGSQLDILAPGGDGINSKTQGMVSLSGVGDITYSIGTSFSAPIVSGILAMVLEANPNLTSSEVEKLLRNTADKIGDKQYIDGHNSYYGYGKINVTKLLNTVKMNMQ